MGQWESRFEVIESITTRSTELLERLDTLRTLFLGPKNKGFRADISDIIVDLERVDTRLEELYNDLTGTAGEELDLWKGNRA
jgi:hypothetical protein